MTSKEAIVIQDLLLVALDATRELKSASRFGVSNDSSTAEYLNELSTKLKERISNVRNLIDNKV